MPSLASTEAAYEPPGPPPTTNTVHLSGISIDSAVGNDEVCQILQRIKRQYGIYITKGGNFLQ